MALICASVLGGISVRGRRTSGITNFSAMTTPVMVEHPTMPHKGFRRVYSGNGDVGEGFGMLLANCIVADPMTVCLLSARLAIMVSIEEGSAAGSMLLQLYVSS